QIAEPEVLEGSDHVSDVDQLLGLVEHHDDAHAPNQHSAECGMRNAERKGGRRKANDLALQFRIPHSALRIRFIPPAPAPRTAPDPAGLHAATPSRCRRSTLTQPLPPLHTSCPARRTRPGSISLM